MANIKAEQFSKIDRNILKVLQKEGRTSYADLSRQVGLTSTPCMERVKRLERDKVIEGYHARINPIAMGLGLTMFVQIRLNRTSEDTFRQFKQRVHEVDEIQECFLISGNYDFLLKARCADMVAYREFYGETLLGLPGVEECTTLVVMEEVKETQALPIP